MTLLRTLVLLLFVFSGVVHAQLPQSKDPEVKSTDYWETRWKELCSYDRMCSNLKNGDGTWREPKKEVLEAIKALKPAFIKYGLAFGVDPVSIAGAIMSENSLNVTISDGIQDFLVKMKIAGNGKIPILGKSFSFGWGQLYMEAATEAEVFAAKFEKRELRTADQVSEMLLTPDGAVYYAAALEAKIIADYRAQGFDISNNPGAITSLYNLGGSAARAKLSKEKGVQPKVNYFGFFVEKNIGALKKIFNQDYKKDVAEIVKTDKSNPNKTEDKQVRFAKVSMIDLPLYSGYTTCSLEGNFTKELNEYQKYTSMKLPRKIGTLKQNEEWIVVSESIDCDLEPWKLIRTESGVSGWIKESTLNKSLYSMATKKPPCTFSKRSECQAQIQALNKKYFLKNDNGKLEFRLSGPKDKVDFRYANIGCVNGSNVGMYGNYKPPVPATMDELGQVIKAIEAKREELRKFLKLEKLPEFTLPTSAGLYQVFSQLLYQSYDQLLKSYDPGAPGDTKTNILFYGMAGSQISINEALDAVNGVIVKEDISLAEFTAMTSKSGYLSIVTYGTGFFTPPPNPVPQAETDKVIAMKKASLEKLNKCRNWIPKDWSESHKVLDAAELKLKAIMTINDSMFSVIDSLIGSCMNYQPVFKPAPSQTFNGTCNANIQTNRSNSYGNISISLQYDVIRKLVKTDPERDSFLALQLDNYHQIIPVVSNQSLSATGAALPGSRNSYKQPDEALYCSYDPIETQKIIEKMLKNNCVQSIQVPDGYILNKLNENSKVIYRPFVDNDRFVVDTGCFECPEAPSK